MMKKLFIKKLKINLKNLSIKSFNKKFKDIDEDKFNIINKDDISIDDLWFLLGDNSLECIYSNKKIDRYLEYFIYRYLIDNGSNKDIKFVMEKLGYKYSIDDINDIDKYLKYRRFNDNNRVLELINKIYIEEQSEEESLFKRRIEKLEGFRQVIIEDVFPSKLINKFVRVRNSKNLYWQLVEIEKVIKENVNVRKEMIFIYLTYNYSLDNNLNDLFDEHCINRVDVISFIKKCESNNLILNDNRLKNLLKNFKYMYYKQNNLLNLYKELSKKVMIEYSKYSNNRFYFKIEEFIEYYNSMYNDDFSFFIFSNERIGLTKEIVYSLFNFDSLLGNYYLFKGFNCGTFRRLDEYSDNFDRDQNDIYIKRKKFRKKYKVKINELFNNEDIDLKYFIVKNIPSFDRGEFLELVRCEYRELISRKISLKNKMKLFRNDLMVELSNSAFSKRFEIIDKYIEYSRYMKCDDNIPKEFYDNTLIEFERKYYLGIANEILDKLREKELDGGIESLYRDIEVYVKKNLMLSSIDDIFNKLSKRNNYIKEEYFSIKKRIGNVKCLKRKM